ncbi:serine/threonine dehydratase [Marinicella litoralis]|uniref:Threonine dehydratase n=1 Tax=Marinicella litoralis TaxID=644220 RepID=A0A4R6XW31_9GAMM|nr:serine/threonine dehydratase [Marinicella litoralis]TDR22640.1 threonine dehydratase [Marinicella litoralis]
MIKFQDIKQAQHRIKPYINDTPVLSSTLLNQWLGHEIYFKAECLQKIGAFKARGGCNAIQVLREQHNDIKRVVAQSSGNHAQAVAWAAAQFALPATIFMPVFASKVKTQATRSYGAEVKQYKTRMAVDQAVEAAAAEAGVYWIPPYNDYSVIAGQGTVALEALQQVNQSINAVFAPCGGGGLISGSLVATRELQPKAQVIAAEPMAGDDAFQSYQTGQIQHLDDAPKTLADGAMTLSIGEKTFEHIKHLDDFYTVAETPMAYWTQWLQHLLKLHVEPTSAMTMDAVCQWLRKQTSKQKVLVIISGGNIDVEMMQKIWQVDYLCNTPALSVNG